MAKHRVYWLCACVLTVASVASSFAQPSVPPKREISPIRGDLYRASEDGASTVFLAASDGILLADPLNTEFARWLKTEFDARFPGRPVRYIVLSSHRYERAAGAWIFNDTAEIVGHERFLRERGRAAGMLPGRWAALDRNEDQLIDRSELTTAAPEALARDLNKNGEITAAEAWGDVASPEAVYQSRRTIAIGGRSVDLLHPGDGLGLDRTLLFFPDERVLFAPGLLLREAPATFSPSSPLAFAGSLEQLERLDADTVMSEKGEAGTLADVRLLREYVEAMASAVRAGFKSGQAVEQLQSGINLGTFSGLAQLEGRRGPNIAETYRRLQLLQIDVFGASEYAYLQRGTPSCARSAVPSAYTACAGIGGSTTAFGGGVIVTVGRFGASWEHFRAGQFSGRLQFFGSPALSRDLRETTTTTMFRYQLDRTGALQVAASAGYMRVSAAQRFEQLGFGGRVPLEFTAAGSTAAFGADITVAAGAVRFVIPVRAARLPGTLFDHDDSSKWSLRVGAGIAVPVLRSVIG